MYPVSKEILGANYLLLGMASTISLPSSDWSRSTYRYRTDALAATLVSPHVTFIPELMRSLLFAPKRIYAVFPKWLERLFSTIHPLREESSLPSLSSISSRSTGDKLFSFFFLFFSDFIYIYIYIHNTYTIHSTEQNAMRIYTRRKKNYAISMCNVFKWLLNGYFISIKKNRKEVPLYS